MNSDYLSRAALDGLGLRALGENVRLHPSCVLVGCANIAIGSNVRIDPYCVITASAPLEIGSYVHVSSHTAIVGGAAVSIGDFCAISHGAKLLAVSDRFDAGAIIGAMVGDEFRDFEKTPILMERHAAVGAGSVVLPGACFGEGATLGALSMARGELTPWTTYAGIPARPIRGRNREAVLEAERRFLSSGA